MTAWSYERAEEHVLSLELFGMRFGLDRMRRLLTVLDSPQRAYRAVHVVGTNGKSSTARMTAELLEAHGVRTGTYLSPHLVSYAERIRIGDADLSPEAFAAAIGRTVAAAEKVNRGLATDDRVTQFELLTAAALSEFAEQGVEVAVVEAGLGGRHDATNVLDAEVVVLTNVGLEHTRWLGPTVLDIAREKLAVVRPGATLVLGDVDPEVEAEAATLGATPGERRQRPRSGDLALPGYQRRNFELACAAAEAVLGRPLEQLPVADVPGRFQVVDTQPRTIVDGAHNPAGVAALAESLPDGVVGVVSILDDKDAAEMLAALAPRLGRLVCTASLNPRALSPATLASLAAQLGVEAEVEPDPPRALARARELAGPQGTVVATGSIYLVADLLAGSRRRRASAL